MSISYQQKNDEGILTIEGELGLAHAEELRMALIRAIIDVDQLSLDMTKSTSVDLSALQMFCSAHRSAVRMNKRVSFSSELPEPVRQTVRDAGYARTVGCRLDCTGTCLWVPRPASTVNPGREGGRG